MHTRMQAIRPMRSLLNQLPRLPITDECMVDYEAADPRLLVAIRDDAELTMRVIHLGLAGSPLSCRLDGHFHPRTQSAAISGLEPRE